MVQFYDPIRKIELSYYIDRRIVEKWDKIRGGKLIKKDEDRVYLVDGRERSGKSVFSIQQAKYLDPTFNLSRVCFTPDEFLNAIRTAPQGSAIVFDEAFRGLSSKGTQSKVNKKIVQAMMEMGQRNLIVFIVLPTFFLLELYAAVLRSNCLFHVYKDKKGHRRFRLYNYQKKSFLYKVGKKKGFSYAYPKVKHRDRFFNKYAIDEQSYRKRKAESLREQEKQIEDVEEGRISKERKVALANWAIFCKEQMKMSQQQFINMLKEVNVNMTQQNISQITSEIRKRGLITSYNRQ